MWSITWGFIEPACVSHEYIGSKRGENLRIKRNRTSMLSLVILYRLGWKVMHACVSCSSHKKVIQTVFKMGRESCGLWLFRSGLAWVCEIHIHMPIIWIYHVIGNVRVSTSILFVIWICGDNMLIIFSFKILMWSLKD